MVLKGLISVDDAEDLVWRRETRNEKTDKHYCRTKTEVKIERLRNFEGLDIVVYANPCSNINPTPACLADLAIKSARSKAGKEGNDGISYLISVKKQGISTPLMPGYEEAILDITHCKTLEEALNKVHSESYA